MKYIKFKECNTIFAKDQSQYLQLPAHKSDNGCVTICIEITIWEYFKLLFTRRLWLSLLTFNKPLQPLKITIKKPVILKKNNIREIKK